MSTKFTTASTTGYNVWISNGALGPGVRRMHASLQHYLSKVRFCLILAHASGIISLNYIRNDHACTACSEIGRGWRAQNILAT